MEHKPSDGMKNVAKITTGTGISQMISILSMPLITRIYGAEIMGIWITIYTFAVLLNTVSDMGLIHTIMMEEERASRRIYSVVIVLILAISGAGTVVIGGYCFFLLQYDLHLTLVVSGFAFLVAVPMQLAQLMSTWLNRNKSYSVLMKTPMMNQIAVAVVSITLGLAGFRAYGYYIGVVTGQVVTLVYLRRHVGLRYRRPALREIRQTLEGNLTFVTYQMPSNITLQIRNQLPNLLIGGLFGNTVLGYYSISQRLLNIPVTFLGQSLGKVFYQRCAEMSRSGLPLGEFIHRNLTRAMKLAFLPMALFAAFGDAAIVMFFGTEYAIGGVIVRIIVFRSFFTFVSTATQGMEIVLRKQKYAMWMGIAQTLGVAAAVIAAYVLTRDIIVCSVFITVVFIVIQIVYFCVMFRVMEMPAGRFLKSVLLSLMAVLVAALVLRSGFLRLADVTGWPLLLWLRGFMVG